MRKANASYTIEAAIILPALMVVIASLYVLFTAMVLEIRLESAMESVGRRASAYYLGIEKIAESLEKEEEAGGEKGKKEETAGFEALLEDAVGSVLWFPVSETVVKAWVLSEVGEVWTENPLIDGGAGGVSFFGSRYDAEEETIVLNVNYRLQIPFLHVLPVSIPLNHRSVHRVWSGKPMEKAEAEEEMVYVTETGTAYHTSIGCHYLKLSIREVPLAHIPKERNESGGKYYPCEKCGDGSGMKVFITSYGTRYHFERNCSELKRGIRSIPISQVGDRTLCKKCAKKEGK